MERERARGRRRLRLVALVVAAGLVTSACAGDDSGDGGEASPGTAATSTADSTPSRTPPSSTPEPIPGTVLTAAASDFGPMLFDARGQAIYLFEVETAGVPACYGDCAAAWPPVLTTGPPEPTGAVRADLLGTVPRDDGSTQVTYNGHPLYFYANEDPGQVLCHDVVLNGGRWLVITPDGAPGPV
jgi:predicted lipoprotein with Yx(FWY)xxD motif